MKEIKINCGGDTTPEKSDKLEGKKTIKSFCSSLISDSIIYTLLVKWYVDISVYRCCQKSFTGGYKAFLGCKTTLKLTHNVLSLSPVLEKYAAIAAHQWENKHCIWQKKQLIMYIWFRIIIKYLEQTENCLKSS